MSNLDGLGGGGGTTTAAAGPRRTGIRAEIME